MSDTPVKLWANLGLEQQGDLLDYTEPSSTTAESSLSDLIQVPANTSAFEVDLAEVFPSIGSTKAIAIKDVSDPGLAYGVAMADDAAADQKLLIRAGGIMLVSSSGAPPKLYIDNTSTTRVLKLRVCAVGNAESPPDNPLFPSTVSSQFIRKDTLQAAGDLIAASAASTPVRIEKGNNSTLFGRAPSGDLYTFYELVGDGGINIDIVDGTITIDGSGVAGAGAIPLSVVQAAGDMVIGTGSGTVVNLPAGDPETVFGRNAAGDNYTNRTVSGIGGITVTVTDSDIEIDGGGLTDPLPAEGANDDLLAVVAGSWASNTIQNKLQSKKFIGAGTSPTITSDTGVGSHGSVQVIGTDTAGIIVISTNPADTPPNLATIAKVTFGTSWLYPPKVLLTPVNTAAADLAIGTVLVPDGEITTTFFNVKAGSAALPATSSTRYIFSYHVLGVPNPLHALGFNNIANMALSVDGLYLFVGAYSTVGNKSSMFKIQLSDWSIVASIDLQTGGYLQWGGTRTAIFPTPDGNHLLTWGLDVSASAAEEERVVKLATSNLAVEGSVLVNDKVLNTFVYGAMSQDGTQLSFVRQDGTNDYLTIVNVAALTFVNRNATLHTISYNGGAHFWDDGGAHVWVFSNSLASGAGTYRIEKRAISDGSVAATIAITAPTGTAPLADAVNYNATAKTAVFVVDQAVGNTLIYVIDINGAAEYAQNDTGGTFKARSLQAVAINASAAYALLASLSTCILFKVPIDGAVGLTPMRAPVGGVFEHIVAKSNNTKLYSVMFNGAPTSGVEMAVN
jgi:hypothetical protein